MIEHLQKALTFMLKHEKCSEKSHIRQIIVINGHIYIIAFKTKNPFIDSLVKKYVHQPHFILISNLLHI